MTKSLRFLFRDISSSPVADLRIAGQQERCHFVGHHDRQRAGRQRARAGSGAADRLASTLVHGRRVAHAEHAGRHGDHMEVDADLGVCQRVRLRDQQHGGVAPTYRILLLVPNVDFVYFFFFRISSCRQSAFVVVLSLFSFR